MHDLEEPDAAQLVIKETREAIKPDEGVSGKLAFQASNDSKATADHEPGAHRSTSPSVDVESNDSNVLWEINNSIEISKGKAEGSQTESNKQSDPTADFESDFEEGEDAASKEFVPSKWNQSLVPSRSAIKSPEQQHKVTMKKSVSFERKKTQLVYEYPPPPPEEEEKVVTSVASSSIPFSSSLGNLKICFTKLFNDFRFYPLDRL